MSDNGPVRVGRFEWERLMMMSDLPEQDRFKLLALAIFMDGETGGSARPGNAGLALFGPHEVTWKKLLRRTVAAGWLILVQRGGARRGSGGTTIRRASVYAAAVPHEVWERREEILSSLPFRSPEVDGGAGSDPIAMKGAPKDSFHESMKGAPRGTLQNTEGPFEGSTQGPPSKIYEGSIQGFEGSPQGLPHHAVPTSSSSTTAGKPASSGQQHEQPPKPNRHQVADDLTAAFWEHHKSRRSQSFIAVRGVVRTAIGNGIDRDDLARALDQVAREGRPISGGTLQVALQPARQPSALARITTGQTLTGTDARVAGWAALAAELEAKENQR